MFTSQLVNQTQPQVVNSYKGVDLSNYNCHPLTPNDQLYNSYDKKDLHYVVNAVQKGLKPPTMIGIKRLKRKNMEKKKKNLLNKKNNSNPAPLIPKSPQAVCLKAIRQEFLSKLQNSHSAVTRYAIKKKSPKIIKRKENQRKRRNQLIRLVKKYKSQLLPHFSNRLQGYGRCPKISRQEIKDYLLTKGIVAQLDPAVVKPGPENITRGQDWPLDYSNIQMLNNQISTGLNINPTPILNGSDFSSLLG